MDMGLIRDALAEIVNKKNDWVSIENIILKLKRDPSEIRKAVFHLYKGAYIIKNEDEDGLYKVNSDISKESMHIAINAALTEDDLCLLSPIEESDRQLFRYQRRAEEIILKDQIDKAKDEGDTKLKNLEELAISSSEALNRYIKEKSKKDKKLLELMQIASRTENAFWTYAKELKMRTS